MEVMIFAVVVVITTTRMNGSEHEAASNLDPMGERTDNERQ